jgi:phosphohistidine phosphatase SixA
MRRPLLLATSVALALLFVAPPTRAAGPASSGRETIAVVVRHAEKVRDGSADPPLAAAGERRARDLDRTLTGVRVAALISTPYRRTRETLRPLSERTGLPITETAPGDDPIAATVRAIERVRGGAAVVSGHSNTVAGIVEALTGVRVRPVEDHENDRMFVVVREADGRRSVVELRFGEPSRAPTATGAEVVR